MSPLSAPQTSPYGISPVITTQSLLQGGSGSVSSLPETSPDKTSSFIGTDFFDAFNLGMFNLDEVSFDDCMCTS